jgi:hypothetical protein
LRLRERGTLTQELSASVRREPFDIAVQPALGLRTLDPSCETPGLGVVDVQVLSAV